MRVIDTREEFLQLLWRALPPGAAGTIAKLEAIAAAVKEGRSVLIGVQGGGVYISPRPEMPPRFLICDEQGEAHRVALGG